MRLRSKWCWKDLMAFCPQAKVLQCDFKWICLLQNVESKKLLYHWKRCSHNPTCFLTTKTGETLAATSSVMCVPEIQRFSQCAPILVHHVCTDKHAANMRCENLRSQLPGRELWTKAHLTCDVHRLYRATTCSMKICEADVSGVLSIGLAHQANAGIYRSIVVVLGQIFLEHLQVFYEEPPEQFSGHSGKACLIALCLLHRATVSGVAIWKEGTSSAVCSMVTGKQSIWSTTANGDAVMTLSALWRSRCGFLHGQLCLASVPSSAVLAGPVMTKRLIGWDCSASFAEASSWHC